MHLVNIFCIRLKSKSLNLWILNQWDTLVCLIRSENFEQEVIAEKRPVLILCMPRDDEFPQQLKVMEDIATKHSQELKVGCAGGGAYRSI